MISRTTSLWHRRESYGYAAIQGFRAARSPVGLMRRTDKTVITTYGRDTAVASTLFYREGAPGKVGRQMQTWARFPEGWEDRRRAGQHHRRSGGARRGFQKSRSSDDLPTLTPLSGEAETPVRRVDRPSPLRDKVTRAEELRLQLADEIVARRAAAGIGARRDGYCAALFGIAHAGPRSPAPAGGERPGRVRAHRGAVVAQPSPDRLKEMFEAMAELEALCAWFAAERMPPGDRQKLEAIHDELRVLSHAGNPERFHEVNERFHNAIYAGSQNGYIAEMTLATRVRVQPFRRAQFRNSGRLAKSHAEHDRVVVAIMRGDKAGAAAAMRAHIELVRGEYELYAVSV